MRSWARVTFSGSSNASAKLSGWLCGGASVRESGFRADASLLPVARRLTRKGPQDRVRHRFGGRRSYVQVPGVSRARVGAPSRERSAFFTPERDGRQDAIRGSDRPSREPLIIARRTSVVQCAGLAVDVYCVRRCRTHLPGSLQYDGNRVCLIDLGSPDKRPRLEVSLHGPACPSCGKLLAQEGCLDLTKHSRRTKTFEDGLKASIKGVVFADGSCPADRCRRTTSCVVVGTT